MAGEKTVFTGVGTKQKEAAAGMMEAWFAAEATCESAIGKARSKCGNAKDDIIEQAERMGIKRKVFKEAMKKAKLIGKAHDCGSEFEDDLARVFENLEIVLGLPLFDAAGVDADGGNVHPISGRGEGTGAGAAA
jgi:hypothetical protein